MELITALKKILPQPVKAAIRRTQYNLRRYRYRSSAAGFPIPPPEENFLVTGVQNVEWYVDSGKLAKYSIRFALERNLVDMNDFTAILDFGCGSGRVIRYWKDLTADVYGTDYNPKLIEWCSSNLPFAHFMTNQLQPPLDYASESFDLVYALSVFTHLDEAGQYAWRDELSRVLRRGGYLIITTHGACPAVLSHLTDTQRNRFEAGELVVVHAESAGSNQCAAYHPEKHVRTRLGAGLEIIDVLRGGAWGNPYQDLWLLRKPA
jgi:SAM-dependent methyltransferase